MKKYIVMALLAVAILPACKKDKNNCEACKPANELIKGTWAITSARSEYFNTANTTEPNATVQQTKKYKYVITANKIRRINTETNNVDFDTAYTLNNLNSKNTITFTGEAGVETYDLVSLTNDRMQWQQVKTNQEYTTVGGTENKVTAAKTVTIIDFQKSNE